MSMLHNKCILCEYDKLKKLPRYYEMHSLVKCTHCGLVFAQKIPTEHELNEYYAEYSYTKEAYLSPITIKSYNLLLDEFEPYRKTNRILDVGCGRGWFLIEAKKRGWEVYGTEFSESAMHLCESQGITMKKGALNANSFSLEMFDVITSFEVIEHINNPNQEINHIQGFLRKGGLFYCTTPNYNSILRYYLKEKYDVITYPEHLTYYTKRTLKRLMIKNGFRVNKIATTGISITRLKNSKSKGSEGVAAKESSDEKLREKIDKKRYLNYLKFTANSLLTLLGIGMSLKGMFVKK